MNLAPKPPPELEFVAEDRPAEICERVAGYALREAGAWARRRFFAAVAVALGRAGPREGGLEAGAELARELARHVREPWVRDGIERGLDLFTLCVDETGRRCVAALVAEYFGWREAPDLFFHRVGSIFARRSAAELVRTARVTAGYACMPKPTLDELRLVASVPCRTGATSRERRLTIVSFSGDPFRERLRSATQIPSLGSDGLLVALADAGLGLLAQLDDTELPVPLVGRPLLWFPREADHDLRRLHLILASAIA
ncbi:hypothetical protein ENSA5_17410 [Enhygromyxa salina]|uniref:Uncharacterized protein n=2 Tax=Enhygromyxa salina TaxID=215803 RepID=A0A2S9YE18_9BACT|nr:hypothetical protein ENSA5_17410 [Enhygromyxa salina]